MKTFILNNEIDGDDALYSFINKNVSELLLSFDKSVQKVEIHLSNASENKRDENKACTVCVKSQIFPEIRIKEIDKNPSIAIKRSITRVKRSILRRLKHYQTINRLGFSHEIITLPHLKSI